jgi:AraC family transcriptional regulator
MSITAKALWYIESHLSGDASLDAIAAVAGVSQFHLSRAFGTSTGYSLGAYVRARRLTGAARQLAEGAPDILAIALDAGYSSHEAFTRAFRQHFGQTPEGVRAQAALQSLKLTEPLRMQPSSTVPLAPPRVVESGELLIFGLGQHYNCQSNAGIPSQWDAFLPHFGHIPGQQGRIAFGVICNFDDAGNYDYICGVEVSAFPAHPPEFTRLRIPPRTYAVF